MTPKNIEAYIKDAYETASQHGFFDSSPSIADLLMGIVSELGEAYQSVRYGKIAPVRIPKDISDKPSREFIDFIYKERIEGTLYEELIDALIRLFSLCGYLDFTDIEPLLQFKLNYNKTRPKYNGKES
jgi:hypothetical protein